MYSFDKFILTVMQFQIIELIPETRIILDISYSVQKSNVSTYMS